MKTQLPLFVTILLLHLTTAVHGNVYEGFDMTDQSSALLASSDATRIGTTSSGWRSTWQVTAGRPLLVAEDLEINGLNSVGGSVLLIGERKPNSIGKGVAMRQIVNSYEGDVYGSFRFRAGTLRKESSFGLLLSIPSPNPLTPRSATFAFCPKHWGSKYGMLAAGKQRVEKSAIGAPHIPNSTYLVVWQLENLPAPGKRKTIVLNMWVLGEDQATHFASNDFSESALRSAEQGAAPEQVAQYIRKEIKDSARGLFGGMIASCFSAGMPKVTFDEVRISDESVADAVGLNR
jgi:hypothetical protein